MKTYFRLNIFLFLAFFLFFLSTGIILSAQKPETLPHPKNIILMIGDGMGYNQIKATDYYFHKKQVYEDFPVIVAMAHYPAKAGKYVANDPNSNYFANGYNTVDAWKDTAYLKRDFTESAAAATAMATGYKTYNNAIGLSITYDTLENLTELAKSLGKSAGVVTSVELSDATPAGFVTHNRLRTNYSQIAYDMLLKSRCDVIMGCGDPSHDNDGLPLDKKWKSPVYAGDSSFWVQLVEGSGKRTQFEIGSKTLTTQDVDGDGIPDPWSVVKDLRDFNLLAQGQVPKRVFGCPKVYTSLQQMRTYMKGETKDSPPNVTPFVATVPSLSVMATGALNVLGKNKKGFFVMIEGGAVDRACHANQKGRMIEEMKSFNDAIESVIRWVNSNSNWNETLLIITGDHETGLLWGPEPLKPLVDKGSGNLPTMNFYSTNHSNSLIALYAKGAGSEWFRKMADEYDAVRGPYIQNSEIAQLVHFLWAK